MTKEIKKKLIVAFSGGRTSGYMTWWIMNNLSEKYEIIVVFANTGKEREETLEFVKKCDEYFWWNIVWIEAVTNPEYKKGVSAKVVSFETASRNGEPFEAMIAKHGIPNKTRSVCSRELKAYAIRAYARQIGWRNYQTAIGIRHDETSRLDFDKAKKERLIYPLATIHRVFKNDINRFWLNMPFDLNLKTYQGNCDLCWKKSNRKIVTILSETPEAANWWREMEVKYGSYVPDSQKHNQNIKLPNRFFREHRSVDNLIELSNKPFEKALDESQEIDFYKQMEMFDVSLDEHGSCTESCEAF